MSDFQQSQGFDYVTLVDRAGKGGCEIIYDGVRIVFKPGQTERPVPQFLAEWLMRVDQQKVHTTNGEYVQRFGVKNAPEELTRLIGEVDCSPITIDGSRAEGWDTDSYAPDRGATRTVQLKRGPGDYANDAAGMSGASYGKER